MSLADFRGRVRHMSDEELSYNPKDKKRCAYFANKPGLFSGVHRCLFAMKDVVALTHGPPGCNFACKTICGELYLPPHTNTAAPNVVWDESSLVFGNEKNLEEAILEVHRIYRPEAIVVLATNTSGTIGEDIAGVAAKMQEGLKIPVLAIPESVDFASLDQEGGDSIPLVAIIEQLMSPPLNVYDTSVNLMLCVDWKTIGPKGNVGELTRLLEKMGIRVNMVVPVGNSIRDFINNAAKAALNVLLTPNHEPVARAMEEKFGTPYIAVEEPFGLELTRSALQAVANRFNLEAKAAQVINEEEKATFEYIEKYLPFLKGVKAGVQNYGSKAPMQALALVELGLDVKVIVLREPTKYSLLQTKKICARADIDPEVLIDPSLVVIEEILDTYDLDLLFGAWTGTAPADVRSRVSGIYSTEPKAEALWGYRGHMKMARDLAHMVSRGFSYKFKKYLKEN